MHFGLCIESSLSSTTDYALRLFLLAIFYFNRLLFFFVYLWHFFSGGPFFICASVRFFKFQIACVRFVFISLVFVFNENNNSFFFCCSFHISLSSGSRQMWTMIVLLSFVNHFRNIFTDNCEHFSHSNHYFSHIFKFYLLPVWNAYFLLYCVYSKINVIVATFRSCCLFLISIHESA